MFAADDEVQQDIKDKQGVLKTEAEERLQRWVEHFSEVPNRYDPVNLVN